MFDKCLCVKDSSENLLKTAKAECAQIITPSFNSNIKFLMNKNMCLNAPEVVEIGECWLNLFTNVMRTLTPFSAPVFKGNKLDCLLHQFVPTHNKMHSIKLSRKVNNHIIAMLNLYQPVQVAAMYKQRANKIQSMSSFKSNERALESDSN